MKNKIFLMTLFFCVLFANTDLLTKPTIDNILLQTKDHEKNKTQLLNDIDWSDEARPVATHYEDSPSGNFRVHYNIDGPNAVDLTDVDHNNIPDYVDSVLYYSDYVNNFYVFELGYKPFAMDLGRGGSTALSIYLWELGDDALGDGGIYGECVASEAIEPRRTYGRSYSFLVIDNDFSLLDSNYNYNTGLRQQTFHSTYGYDALKVTIAHELHHAVQSIYGVSPYTGHTFQEMTSVFYEHRIFPEIKDYYQYSNLLLERPEKYPMGVSNDLMPYCYGIFLQYVHKKYGDNAIKKIWEYAYDGVEHFIALDSIFGEYGSNFNEAWKEFSDWMYHTGERAKGDSLFDDAPHLNTMKFLKEREYASPEISEFMELKSLQFTAYRVAYPIILGRTNDTLDVLLTNSDINAARYNSHQVDTCSWLLSDSKYGNSEELKDLNTFFTFIAGKPESSYQLYSKVGTKPVYIDYAYPNPYNPNEVSDLTFSVPTEAFLYDKVMLYVYTIDMKPVVSKELAVSLNKNNSLVVRLEDARSIIDESGVYVFRVEHKKGETIGKFAVSRR